MRAAGRRLDLLLVLSGMALLLLTPRTLGGDGQPRLDAVRALADGHLLHERYSLVEPVLALPLEVLGRLVGHEPDLLYRFNGLVLAAGVLALHLLLRRVSPPLARTVPLLLVFGSMLPAHVVSLYGETVTAVGLAVGLLLALTGVRPVARGAGWAVAVVAVVNTPAAIPAFGLLVAVHALRTRQPAWLLLVAAAVGLSVLDLRLHTGSFASPYARDGGMTRTELPYSALPGFSYPAGFGVLVILLSFGKGLLFFTPGLFLPVRRRLPPALAGFAALSTAFVVGLVAVYCRWWAWYGGYFWGPRFFLYASVTAALVLAVRLATPEPSLPAAVATLAALVLSTWVAVTAAIGNVAQDTCLADSYAREYLCWYSPEFSVLWTPLRQPPDLTTAQTAYAVLAVLTSVRLGWPLAARLLGDAARALRTGGLAASPR